jgi:hypothetical protein
MTDQNIDLSPLSSEQIDSLSQAQKDIFLALDEKDRQFFAKNFSAENLGKALERKWETIQSRSRITAFDDRLKESLLAKSQSATTQQGLTTGDLAMGAAGLAGVVGVGVLASQIAPLGKASWRGVKPDDLVSPLAKTFAHQEKTDLQFEPPNSEGVLHGAVYLRTPEGLIPGLTIALTPLAESTEVHISKVSSEGVLEAVKDGGQKLLDLIQDGFRLSKNRQDMGNLFEMAGRVLHNGVDIAKTVKDLNLEDKAWETIQHAAEPIQKIYDEEMAAEKARLLKLEIAWDDYYNCPKCRVAFSSGDLGCRVCGTARPDRPSEADPRAV